MLKKLLTASMALALSSNVWAYGAPYVGVSSGIKTNTANIVNFRGVPGNLFFGYGANLDSNFYLAGEIFGTAGTITIKDNGLKSTWAYGLSFLPGLMISDHTMAFARLSLMRTHFTPSAAGSSQASGVQLGVGLQTSLTQNWDLRGEYDYTGYKTVSGVSGSPRGDDFRLGLVYKFD